MSHLDINQLRDMLEQGYLTDGEWKFILNSILDEIESLREEIPQ